MTITTNLPTPKRALAIAAHPDDIEFGSGATLAKWARAGCEVSLLVCTDGSKGTWDAGADTSQLVVTRQVEQRAAAAALGASGNVVFLGWTDGELDSALRQRMQVAAWIRRLRPNVVFGHDPWKRYRLHPDHRHAGLLTVEGVVAARDPHFFPEQGLAHHRPDELLLFEAQDVDHVEQCEGFEADKLAALLSHKSQFESTMHVTEENAGEIDAFRERELNRMRAFGELIGTDLAEGFKRISDL